jgi:hypothetical protein
VTRFAKIPGEVLDILERSDRRQLAFAYAALSSAREFDDGSVRAASWAELAVIMRCSERAARKTVPALRALHLVAGNPPKLVLPHTLNPGTDPGTDPGSNTPILQRVPEKHRGLRILPLWADFIEGRSGERPTKVPPAPSAFTKAVRAIDADPETLSRICRLAGACYSDCVPNFANAMDRGLAALSRGERTRPLTGKEWLDA